MEVLHHHDKQDNPYDWKRIAETVRFTIVIYKGRFREGTEIPYVVHPLDVFSILLKAGASEDVVIAGLLQDIVEVSEFTIQQIKNRFGENVGDLVEGASDPETLTKGILSGNVEKRDAWKHRKSLKIEKLRHSSRDLRLVVCADKLANIRDMLTEQRFSGDVMWKKLNAPKKEDQGWYYHSMVEALSFGYYAMSDNIVYKELASCVYELFGKGT